MWNMIWPIALVVGANTLYNIITKSTPSSVDPFASLTITYLVAAALSLGMFFLTGKDLAAELGKADWTSVVLGAAVVGLEFGYICIYRAGWKVSVGSLAANISLACVLLAVGILIYHEAVSVRQLIGMGVCALGLFLIGM